MRVAVWIQFLWMSQATGSFLVDTVVLHGEEEELKSSSSEQTVLGQPKGSRTKVAKTPHQPGPREKSSTTAGAYYFVTQHTEQRLKPALKNRNDIPERTKKKKAIVAATSLRTVDINNDESKSTKESDRVDSERRKKYYNDREKGKKEGKVKDKGKEKGGVDLCKESKEGKGGKGKRSDKSKSGKGKGKTSKCTSDIALPTASPAPSTTTGKGKQKSDKGQVDTASPSPTFATFGPTACDGKGKGKSKKECESASLTPTPSVSTFLPTRCVRENGKGSKGKSKQECPDGVTTSPAPSISTLLPSDLPSLNFGKSVAPSIAVPRPTSKRPTVKGPPPKVPSPKLPTAKGQTPTRSPKMIPSPLVAPPPLTLPPPIAAPPDLAETDTPTASIGPGPDVTTESPTAPSVAASPTLSVSSVIPTLETPSIGTGATTAPNLTTGQTMAPSMTDNAADSLVPATPFTVTYSGGAGATQMDMDEAAAITLDYLEAYLTSQFALSTETILESFMGALSSTDPAAGTASFDVTAVFAELTSFLPATKDIDALIQAAFSAPSVSGLLTALGNLPDSNPLQGTINVMYNVSRRRRHRHRRRVLSFSTSIDT